MRREEVLQIIKSTWAKSEVPDLSRADLRRTDLSGTNLRQVNLRYADLSRANLRGANLEEADLTGANLCGANLTNAKLKNADLLGVNLTDAQLSGADFVEVEFRAVANIVPSLLLSVLRDITERKQTEEGLLRGMQEVKLAYQQSVIYAKELRAEIAERKRVEEALLRSIQELEMAYQQSVIYAKELKAEIAERKLAEEALRESEEHYRSLVEASPDIIVLADLNANILMINQQGVRLLGYEHAEEMIGKSGFDFITPKDLPRARRRCRGLLKLAAVEISSLPYLRK